MLNLPGLRRPRPERVRRFIGKQRERSFSYAAVGSTASQPPDGYVVDHTRVCLGEGEEAFAAARRALEGFQQFDLGWLSAAEPPRTIREGEIVVVLARLMGLWWLNACRIVYVMDEVTPVRRFGFAYGTVEGHVEEGEERFLVEMDAEGRVWYDILAFSRAAKLATRLGYPYVRRVQKRFGRDSVARLQRAVSSDAAQLVLATRPLSPASAD